MPLLKKPVSEAGKLELTIHSLPPIFASRKKRLANQSNGVNGANDNGNGSDQFDSNWIGLENF